MCTVAALVITACAPDEKTVDLAEVNAQTMSRMAYMKKWRNLTDTEAMDELRQIALERELLEDSFGFDGVGKGNTPPKDQNGPEDDLKDGGDDV